MFNQNSDFLHSQSHSLYKYELYQEEPLSPDEHLAAILVLTFTSLTSFILIAIMIGCVVAVHIKQPSDKTENSNHQMDLLQGTSKQVSTSDDDNENSILPKYSLQVDSRTDCGFYDNDGNLVQVPAPSYNSPTPTENNLSFNEPPKYS